jgi:hypothetical protein
MNVSGPGWYVCKVANGMVVWIKEGPYAIKNEAKTAANDCTTRKGAIIKALWWDGESWSSTPPH